MENSRVKIGFLVPLNNSNKEENGSIPKLPVFEGLNIVGRDDISVSDKRVSRKHISLNVSVDGIINVVVDGSNPVVISSGEERKKLYPREKATIVDGDVVELIPGHHTFKYVVSPGERQGFSLRTEKKTEERNLHENEKQAVKRKRQLEDDETLARSLAVESDFASHQGLEAIRHFRVTKEKLPLTFQLLRVQGLPPWANSSAVSIEDVIQGNVTVAILSNYMVDMDWLISACPTLRKIPHVLVVHGEGDGRLHQLQKNKPANWTFHKPLLPISYGTHHSKAMFLVFPRGLRVVIHTSNLIHVDWNNKSQGLWMQDFPWKDKDDQSKGCGFEIDLIDYLSILKAGGRAPPFMFRGISMKPPDMGVLEWELLDRDVLGKVRSTLTASISSQFSEVNTTVKMMSMLSRRYASFTFNDLVEIFEFGVHFLKNKTDWFDVFARWRAWVEIEIETGSMLKRLGSNGGGNQFCGDEFVIDNASIGIGRLEKILMIPREFGCIKCIFEKAVRMKTKMAKSIKCIFESPKRFWADVVLSMFDIEPCCALHLGLLNEITWTKTKVCDNFDHQFGDARNRKIIGIIDMISNDDVFCDDMDKRTENVDESGLCEYEKIFANTVLEPLVQKVALQGEVMGKWELVMDDDEMGSQSSNRMEYSPVEVNQREAILHGAEQIADMFGHKMEGSDHVEYEYIEVNLAVLDLVVMDLAMWDPVVLDLVEELHTGLLVLEL
ncbi:hypothetical protein GIB67_012206, partial [Kingdonia uniflora]